MMETQTPGLARPAEPSTRARYKVVVFAVLLAALTYLDRACLATLAPLITADLAISKVQMGYVFSAFALAYAAFGIPAARLEDRLGTRRVLSWIVAWWSVFTMLTGAAVGFVSLLLTRTLFGAGEAGAWPGVSQSFSHWIPLRERGRVQGVFFGGAHLAAAVTPAVVAALLTFMPWRMVFASLGLLGIVWSACWYSWFRDEPSSHMQVNAAELESIDDGRPALTAEATRPIGLWKLASTWNIWALCAMYLPNSFALYFCITWLPTYLQERQGFSHAALLYFSGLPLALSVVADVAGGWVVDWSSRRYGVRIGRCGIGGLSYALAGIALCAVPLCHNAAFAATLLAAAVGASMFALPAAWATCNDIGGHHSGLVSATMNTSGQAGSLLSPLIVAYSLKWYGSWNVSIYLMGALFLAGTVFWALVNPRDKLC
jgi:ACS family glucarate transporter-like MFS transporter